jgi:hypothetical protein
LKDNSAHDFAGKFTTLKFWIVEQKKYLYKKSKRRITTEEEWMNSTAHVCHTKEMFFFLTLQKKIVLNNKKNIKFFGETLKFCLKLRNYVATRNNFFL